MKKILLVTLFDYNLGNRLQNYALKTVLEELGFEIFNVIQPRPNFKLNLKRIIKANVKLCLGILGIKKYIADSQRIKCEKDRVKKYRLFNKEYFNNCVHIKYNNYSALKKIHYEYAITGSDQVWHNWDHVDGELEFFYLMFTDSNKRIAYAPSFGFSDFPDNDVILHKQGLLEMNSLSIREKRGSELIEKLIGREAKVVLDPTMLLKKRDWEKIEKKPKCKMAERFMLVYFLGKRTVSIVEEIKKLSIKYNALIIDLSECEYKSIGPDEFLWFINHSTYVCTDSFHAVVFSLIFHKEFEVFKRSGEGFEDMFDRIENILEIVGLENRIFSDKEKMSSINWDNVDNILNFEKDNSMKFIYRSLNLINNTNCVDD